ncbi:FAD-binding domain-containing protein [Daldinia caldariorum]|uniref:FAD-binding domain-containing protein n=1 Tax=Daldinia caldariorum TaxID=326644 RepID=UPI0020075B5C|nr:FAD-binding domain-containing protein [Daldinia caldariorum]KAI1467640.1 FAD-binding domain-containing protein [Daldinia caldariorum]
MRGGIEIWMNQLNPVEIADDGKSVKVGGGALSKPVIDALYAAGKETTIGGCECTSILGPGLGGGHGWLQGRYGLVADQFLSMDIVFANGSLHTIDETSDLWWAMKGAGHNFGIVTSVTMKIYDVESPNWAFASFAFKGDKVEEVYEAATNHLLKNGTQPRDVINFSYFINLPDIDPDNSVIVFFIVQGGVKVVDSEFTGPLTRIGPVATTTSTGTYLDLAPWILTSNVDGPCQKAGLINTRFPIDLETYNVQAQRDVYDLFSSATHETPALNGSVFLLEGYPLQGVQAVPEESTAFPFRGDSLLLAPLILYKPEGEELNKKAAKLGEDLRQTKKQMYGHEEWCQKKMLDLKNKYDPYRKFSFYAPIA